MKKAITLILFIFVVTSCSLEDDTRLLCDCTQKLVGELVDSNYEDKEQYCGDKDIPFVFNESKNKFDLGGTSPDDEILKGSKTEESLEFTDDEIIYKYNFRGENETTYNFNRISLKFYIYSRNLIPNSLSTERTIYYYSCKVVSGV